jgi:hypothetical protein
MLKDDDAADDIFGELNKILDEGPMEDEPVPASKPPGSEWPACRQRLSSCFRA